MGLVNTLRIELKQVGGSQDLSWELANIHISSVQHLFPNPTEELQGTELRFDQGDLRWKMLRTSSTHLVPSGQICLSTAVVSQLACKKLWVLSAFLGGSTGKDRTGLYGVTSVGADLRMTEMSAQRYHDHSF